MSKGNSDVKLVHGQVKVEAWDLCVDSKDRRKNNTPHRRALVHDFDDGLTINWGRDYPGGVTIQGSVTITDTLLVDIPDPIPPGIFFLKNNVGVAIAVLQQKVSELEKQLASIQDNWRWCNKCQGMFFAGNPTKGVCPAGGEHSLEGSGNYRLLK